MIKARIKVALNKRGAPSVNASKDKHYVVGQEVNVVDLINGDLVDGIDVWYKLDNGSYVWSGGVEGMTSITATAKEPDIIPTANTWNIEKFKVDHLWKKTRGEGISVAILDTGIQNHANIVCPIGSKRNFLDASSNTDDFSGHGTHVAGIICCSGTDSAQGIAPSITLHVGKVINSKAEGIDIGVLTSAIEWYSNKVDIISISLGFENEDKGLKKAVNNCKALVVAANGNKKTTSRTNGDFPAGYNSSENNCISVGSCGFDTINDQIVLSQKTIESNSLNIVAPGESIMSTFLNDDFKELSGSSMATPFIAGVLALLKKLNPSMDSKALKTLLLSCTRQQKARNFKYNLLDLTKILDL